MDTEALSHLMTDEEREHFEREGYLFIPNALSLEEVDALSTAIDGMRSTAIADGLTKEADNWGKADLIGQNDAFLNIVDNPRVLPKIWGAMGWNIYLYHTHLHVKLPAPDAEEGEGWMEFHQDSGRVNIEMRTFPQARLSLKAAYFLTDVSEPGRGNFYIIPGSHISDNIPISSEIGRDPAEAEARPRRGRVLGGGGCGCAGRLPGRRHNPRCARRSLPPGRPRSLRGARWSDTTHIGARRVPRGREKRRWDTRRDTRYNCRILASFGRRPPWTARARTPAYRTILPCTE